MKVTFNYISKQLEDYLKSADKSISIAVAWFTNENLFDIILDLLTRKIVVELVVNNDHINNRIDGLDFNEFIKLGGKFYFADSSRLMHHKFIIIDNKIAISGSYNWTYNAEFRNKENIISTDNQEIIEQFKSEYELIKADASLQTDKIALKPLVSADFDEKKYLTEEYYYKSISEEKKGNMKKSLQAIQAAKHLDKSNIKIERREKEIIGKIENPEYHYHIEDGQFSFDFYENHLIGKEGEIVKHHTDRTNGLDEIYILFIDGFYVECIGNVDRSFPENKQEHEEVKQWMLKNYDSF